MNAILEAASSGDEKPGHLNPWLHFLLAAALAAGWAVLLRIPWLSILVFGVCFGYASWQELKTKTPWRGAWTIVDYSIRMVGIYLIIGRVFFHQ